MSLRKNEQLGYSVEDQIRAKFPTAFKAAKGMPYDFSNYTYMIEVKSCHLHIKGDKTRATRHGRFYIHKPSHSEFGVAAKGEGLLPLYIFVLLDKDDKILHSKWYSYNKVTKLLDASKNARDVAVDLRTVFKHPIRNRCGEVQRMELSSVLS